MPTSSAPDQLVLSKRERSPGTNVNSFLPSVNLG